MSMLASFEGFIFRVWNDLIDCMVRYAIFRVKAYFLYLHLRLKVNSIQLQGEDLALLHLQQPKIQKERETLMYQKRRYFGAPTLTNLMTVQN